jgi:hypothetical protein
MMAGNVAVTTRPKCSRHARQPDPNWISEISDGGSGERRSRSVRVDRAPPCQLSARVHKLADIDRGVSLGRRFRLRRRICGRRRWRGRRGLHRPHVTSTRLPGTPRKWILPQCHNRCRPGCRRFELGGGLARAVSSPSVIQTCSLSLETCCGCWRSRSIPGRDLPLRICSCGSSSRALERNVRPHHADNASRIALVWLPDSWSGETCSRLSNPIRLSGGTRHEAAPRSQ